MHTDLDFFRLSTDLDDAATLRRYLDEVRDFARVALAVGRKLATTYGGGRGEIPTFADLCDAAEALAPGVTEADEPPVPYRRRGDEGRRRPRAV